MKRMKLALAGAAVALVLGGSSVAAAQQASGGWWRWALGDALGVTGRGPGTVILDPRQGGGREKDDDGASGSRRNTTIGDVIFGRSGTKQGKQGKHGKQGKQGKASGDRDGASGVYGRAERGGRGPAFCRNGEGHPTKGRQWCVDKGFGLGGGGLLNGVWQEDRGWGDIILGRTAPRTRSGSVLSQGGLRDVLGSVILGRLQGAQQRLGARAPLQGRWLREGDRSLVLQVRSGSRPVAEFTDLNGDGRADVVLIARQ